MLLKVALWDWFFFTSGHSTSSVRCSKVYLYISLFFKEARHLQLLLIGIDVGSVCTLSEIPENVN